MPFNADQFPKDPLTIFEETIFFMICSGLQFHFCYDLIHIMKCHMCFRRLNFDPSI